MAARRSALAKSINPRSGKERRAGAEPDEGRTVEAPEACAIELGGVAVLGSRLGAGAQKQVGQTILVVQIDGAPRQLGGPLDLSHGEEQPCELGMGDRAPRLLPALAVEGGDRPLNLPEAMVQPRDDQRQLTSGLDGDVVLATDLGEGLSGIPTRDEVVLCRPSGQQLTKVRQRE